MSDDQAGQAGGQRPGRGRRRLASNRPCPLASTYRGPCRSCTMARCLPSIRRPGTCGSCGATESGNQVQLRWDDVAAMPVSEVTADFHCVTKFTVLGVRWAGVPTTEILRRFPPAAAVTHVMIWADFGYSANIRISDFAAEDTLLATHRDGAASVRARLPAAAGGPAPVRLEEREVGPGPGVPDRRPARVLGGTRVPQHRRPLAGAALLVSGAGRRRAAAVVPG